MITLLLLTTAFCAAAMIVFVNAIVRAPVAYEDQTGFHLVRSFDETALETAASRKPQTGKQNVREMHESLAATAFPSV
jgi:hypothetical protein